METKNKFAEAAALALAAALPRAARKQASPGAWSDHCSS